MRPIDLCKRLLALTTIALVSACGEGGGASLPPQGITKIVIDTTKSQTAIFGGQTFGTGGSVGTYDKIVGTAYGQLNPNDPKNQVITDIALAEKNSLGMVEYSVDFFILKPSDLSKGSQKVFYESPNRGGKQYGGFAGMTGNANNPGVAADINTTATYPAFLLNRGYTVMWSGWDAEPMVTATPDLVKATLPLAKNPDGSSISGPMYEYIVNDNATTKCAATYFSPVSTDTTKATLTKRQSMTDTPTVVPSTDWAWGGASSCATSSTSTNSNSISFVNGASFQQSWIYELNYTAKDPYVAAVGLAATRDFVAFMRNAKVDSLGTANPLAGNIKSVATWTNSQPSRLINDFIWLGFNQALDGSKVFDGHLSFIGGGNGLGINYRFAQVGRTERNRQNHIAQLEGVFPFSFTTTTDALTGKTDGRNVRCTATNTCPKVMNLFSSNEMWVKNGSLLTSHPNTGLDVVEPANVRNYLVSSGPHGSGTTSTSTAPTTNSQFNSQVDALPLHRGLWVALDEWISAGTTPPASAHSSIDNGTAAFIPSTNATLTALGISQVPQADIGYPNIPSTINKYSGLVTVRNYWNFGPDYNKGILANIPGIATGNFYRSSVPKVDADGHEIAGLRLPEVDVPIGTSSGWALRPALYGGKTDGLDGAEGSGQFVPLAKDDPSKVSGDPRASITARYGTKAAFVAQRASAAQALMNRRLILDADRVNYTTIANRAITVVANPYYPSAYSYTNFSLP
jgi:Alpha/beta hydrolase domain